MQPLPRPSPTKIPLREPVSRPGLNRSKASTSSSSSPHPPPRLSDRSRASGRIPTVTSADSATESSEVSDEDNTTMENKETSRKEAVKEADEVEALRSAITAQMAKKDERGKAGRQTDAKLPSRPAMSSMDRFSTIAEETATGLSPARDSPLASSLPTGAQTASSESIKTIRASALNTPALQYPARTPSYPFPAMNMATPNLPGSPAMHRPFTTLSPTVQPPQMRAGMYSSFRDREASGHATPSSAATFLPQAVSVSDENFQFASPNLYELALCLNSNPGLEPWWSNVVLIMKEQFNATRVTLAVPSDTTDVGNIPWAQIATYNAGEDDEFSLTNNDPQSTRSSLNDSSNADEASVGAQEAETKEKSNLLSAYRPEGRPHLEFRHSFSGFGRKAGEESAEQARIAGTASRRPGTSRMGSYTSTYAAEPPEPATSESVKLSSERLQEHGDTVESQGSSNLDLSSGPHPGACGRVFSIPQPLELESDPLLSSAGAHRVLDRAELIILTREYFDQSRSAQPRSAKSEIRGASDKRSWGLASATRKEGTPANKSKAEAAGIPPRPSTLLSSKTSRESRRPKSYSSDGSKSLNGTWSTKDDTYLSQSRLSAYEDYEQVPASPWSQSPAPSPAIRADEEENPFFKTARVDEDAFADNPPPHDYSAQHQIEAIGVDKGTTVLHIPLVHPLLSKPMRPSRLSHDDWQLGKQDPATHDLLSFGPGNLEASAGSAINDTKTPIAIVSILSPILPYPSNLTSSLKYLAPHLATSFHQSRQLTNALKGAAAVSGRRYGQTNSFGLEGTLSGVQHLKDGAGLVGLSYLSAADAGFAVSANGSVTSPSEYSTASIYSPREASYGSARLESSSAEAPKGNLSGVDAPSHHTAAADSYFQFRKLRGLSRTTSGPIPTIASTIGKRSNSPPNPLPIHSHYGLAADERHKLESKSLTAPNTPAEAPGEPYRVDLDRDANDRSLEDITRTQGTSSRLNRFSTDTSLLPAPNPRDLSPSRHPRKSEVDTDWQAPDRTRSRPNRQHTQLHAHGADFSATFHALPAPSAQKTRGLRRIATHSRAASDVTQVDDFAIRPPSMGLLRAIVDMLPAQMFIAEPFSGALAWINSRFLTYRNQPEEECLKRPWHIVHREDRAEFLELWSQALQIGEQLSHQVRLRRFDHQYRWFHIAIVPMKDGRGIVRHWLGTAMDIHDQHVAEVDAAREKEKAASEAKYRSLANASPQIIFAATVSDGITFANSQWLSYSGQRQEEAQRLGFLDCVHPADVLNCRLPVSKDSPLPSPSVTMSPEHPLHRTSSLSTTALSEETASTDKTDTTAKEEKTRPQLSSGDFSAPHHMESKLARLASDGIIKISRDADGHFALSTEVRLRSKDNEYRWHLVRITLTDFINDYGEAEWYGTCTDINDQKQVEQMLKETMDAKTRFLSNMSHEIRTPLNGIYAAIPFLIGNNLNEDQKDMVDTIRNSAEGLTSLINHILDLSKVEAGMVELKYEWFHVRSMIEDVNDVNSLKANEKCLELSYMADDDVPSMVKGDMNRIRQVLINIVGNAIKFTSHGEVYVHCKILHDHPLTLQANEILLCFEVMDTGSGFNEDEAKLLFKPFSQIDGSSTRQHGGTGLGLAISKQLVELHGGKIAASSLPGKGSTFSFYAKFQAPSADDQPPTPKSSSASSKVPPASYPDEYLRKDSDVEGRSILLDKGWTQSPSSAIMSPESGHVSPAVLSSGSSNPSIRSVRTYRSERSSASSVGPAFALAKKEDPSFMKLALPSGLRMSWEGSETHSADSTDTVRPTTTQYQPRSSISSSKDKALPPAKPDSFRPVMYSILIVCRQEHSRSAMVQHIEHIIPQSIPHQITAVDDIKECQRLIAGDDALTFTHVILNLHEVTEAVQLMDQILKSPSHKLTCLVIITDHSQKNRIMEVASGYDYAQLEQDNRVRFIFKPVKPAKFAVIFDPEKERDLSTDRNKETALLAAVSERQIFDQVKEVLGNRGLKVLAVEDNLINLRMLIHFFKKACIDVETAGDGVQCTNKMFSHDPGYYSVIVCDIQMPNKDGYQTTREIREWERANNYGRIPIIALSANVMSEGLEKSMEAGFDEYVTKPVNWKILGRMLMNLMDPTHEHISLQ